jgi:hypothetical protein
MSKNYLITQLFRHTIIYGTLWGEPKQLRHGIITVAVSSLVYYDGERPQLFYSCGPYASDVISYYLDEYGITWAFTKEELEDE